MGAAKFTVGFNQLPQEIWAGRRLLESDAAAALLFGLDEQLREFQSGFRWRQSFWADVGNTIPVGIGFIGSGLVNEISAKAVRRSQS